MVAMGMLWASILYALGSVCRTAGAYSLAARLMGRAYAAAPLRDARRDRAILLWRELGREREAVEELTALLTTDPGDAAALLNRALAHFELGAYRPALDDLEAWLEHPQRDETLLGIATRYRNQLRGLLEEK